MHYDFIAKLDFDRAIVSCAMCIDANSGSVYCPTSESLEGAMLVCYRANLVPVMKDENNQWTKKSFVPLGWVAC